MWCRRLFIVLSASTLTACASSPVQSTRPQVPASLLQPCPSLTPPTEGTGAALLRTMVEWASLYRECADRHAALAEATK